MTERELAVFLFRIAIGGRAHAPVWYSLRDRYDAGRRARDPRLARSLGGRHRLSGTSGPERARGRERRAARREGRRRRRVRRRDQQGGQGDARREAADQTRLAVEGGG